MRDIGRHGLLCLVLLLGELFYVGVERVISLGQRKYFMEDCLIGRHEESQVAKVIFLEVDTVVVLDKLVAQPHVVMRTSKLVSLSAEKCDREISERVYGYFGRCILGVYYGILFYPVIVFLEPSGEDQLAVVITAHERCSCWEVSEIVLETFYACFGYVLITYHLHA